ncbi:amidohydrolase [Pendulispora brunnea]|uniref:Amidohydrolase n=1 Tax=Pendulispora brunnea TaxID=2905690 RepID=A0ABZ2JXP5_9BACT
MLRAMMAGATIAAARTTLGCNEEDGDPTPPLLDPTSTKRIDTHHHALPPEMKQWMKDQHKLPPQATEPWMIWDEVTALGVMDRLGIQAGVTSMPAPSDIFFDPKAADRGLAMAREGVRTLNDSLANMARRHPTRWGFFAYLPLAHVDFALEELGRAADLGADGFLLMNHFEHRYLGDPIFEPLFAALNARRAVVLTHPDFLPGDNEISPKIEGSLADFMLDTTRGALGMMVSGTLDRYPDISIILPHGGGFLPYIVDRMSRGYRTGDGIDPEKVRTYMRRFYFDTAGPMSSHMTPTLLASADPSRILFGTDYHQVVEDLVKDDIARFAADPALDAAARARIERGNALRLFPNLARKIEA